MKNIYCLFLVLFFPNIIFANQKLYNLSSINSGDTAWILVASILVLFMTVPGIALFYAGMIRKKNILSIILQNFSIAALVTILWCLLVYSLIFSGTNLFIGNFDNFLLKNVIVTVDKVSISSNMQAIPESVFLFFQLTFAIISAAIITGSLVERIKFSALLIFISFWLLLIYAPIAHWVWGGGLLSDGFIANLTKNTIKDFAGGTVVHINAGISGLVACLVLGKRKIGKFTFVLPYNLTLTLIGVAFLWIGWFGFNAGSAGGANVIAGLALVTTQISASIGGITWMICETISKKKPSALGFSSGVVAGLVGITPSAGFVTPMASFFIGIITTIFCYLAVVKIKLYFRYDDTLDAFGIHGIGGIVGALLTGVFYSNIITGERASVLLQFIGVLITIIYTIIVSYIILKIIDRLIGLRVSDHEELQGLDIASHNERLG